MSRENPRHFRRAWVWGEWSARRLVCALTRHRWDEGHRVVADSHQPDSPAIGTFHICLRCAGSEVRRA